MSFRRSIPPALVPVGNQKIALNTTAVSLNSTIRASASVLDVSAETQAARYVYGTPLASTGILIAANGHIRLEGFNGTSDLKFCAAAAGAILQVQGYKYAGEV